MLSGYICIFLNNFSLTALISNNINYKREVVEFNNFQFKKKNQFLHTYSKYFETDRMIWNSFGIL